MQRQETAQEIIDGERFYYNHIKPHMGLDGMTPGQVANIPIPSGNPWRTMIKKAIRG